MAIAFRDAETKEKAMNVIVTNRPHSIEASVRNGRGIYLGSFTILHAPSIGFIVYGGSELFNVSTPKACENVEQTISFIRAVTYQADQHEFEAFFAEATVKFAQLNADV